MKSCKLASPMETSVFLLPTADKVGAKLRPPACQSHKDEGQRGHSLSLQQSVKLCGRPTPSTSLFYFLHPCHKLPLHTPALFFLLILLLLLHKGQAEGGSDAASLPSIWCRMPLSGCQPAHSNEGCHEGYCRLERCLAPPWLLFPSLPPSGFHLLSLSAVLLCIICKSTNALYN